MASRYLYAKDLKKENTEKLYKETVIYPRVLPNEEDIYIIAESFDKLDILAKKYYGDEKFWWVIAIANNINDATLYIEPGRQIRIPANPNDVLSEVNKLNS